MELEFFGAAGEVTGSCHIIRVGGRQLLLDCGMIQGRSKDELRNRDPFPFEPAKIDAVVLSHAHIDHSGRLPLLVKRGFNGPIYTHNASRDLCDILLQDSASLSERDAEYHNRKRARRGEEPIEPLYTRKDARQVMQYLKGVRYRQQIEVLPGVKVRFQDAGHILGSASVELWLEQGDISRKILFSGDLGQYDSPILNDPAVIEEADLVLMESTYGGRKHRQRQLTYDEIGDIIQDASHRHGNVLIPAFAIGRSQEVLYTLGKNQDAWNMDRWQVFLDSPMAIEASKVYWDYPHLYDDEASRFRKRINEMPRLSNLHLTRETKQSMALNKIKSGAIIIAGSGMCSGGRIVHHLKHNLWRKECHLIIVGYQAYGTLGRRLVNGDERVRIHGEEVLVRASIHTVGGLSAHADEDDLARWYGGLTNKPLLWLVHGETKSALKLKQKLQRENGAQVSVAEAGEKIDLAALSRS